MLSRPWHEHSTDFEPVFIIFLMMMTTWWPLISPVGAVPWFGRLSARSGNPSALDILWPYARVSPRHVLPPGPLYCLRYSSRNSKIIKTHHVSHAWAAYILLRWISDAVKQRFNREENAKYIHLIVMQSGSFMWKTSLSDILCDHRIICQNLWSTSITFCT